MSPLRLNPDLPAELERIMAKCLEKDPDLRYQRASEMHSDLQRLKRDLDSGNRAANQGDPPLAEVAQGPADQPIAESLGAEPHLAIRFAGDHRRKAPDSLPRPAFLDPP